MFTGLIADVGTVESIEAGEEGARLRIATRLAAEIRPGDSVAVDGVCLTATDVDDDGFEVEAMNQTIALTALDSVDRGDRVNLELAMKASDRLGGHIVQGHVDTIGEVIDVEEDGIARRIRVRLAPSAMKLMVSQGSIALAGVSLTVATMGDDWIGVSLIPETLERTNLGEATAGRRINVECDVIAKHVERLVRPLARKEQA